MIPKFRAWWIQDEVMTHIYTLEFLQGGIRVSDGCWHEKFLGDEVILMQSTGLEDKNGVEIFEGDIVLENGIQRAVSFGEQEYEEDFGNLAYYVGFNVYTKWGYSSIDPVEYEILGNIYENPELLEAIE